MKWIADKLTKGETVTFRPKGHSMTPLIMSGQEVTVYPYNNAIILEEDDIVLCKVKGHIYLHKIVAVDSTGRFLIGNNKGRINGWTRTIYGYYTRGSRGSGR